MMTSGAAIDIDIRNSLIFSVLALGRGFMDEVGFRRHLLEIGGESELALFTLGVLRSGSSMARRHRWRRASLASAAGATS